MDADALFCPKCGAPRSEGDGDDDLLGKVVGGRYLLIERLGHGGSGTIYRGEHITLRRKVAVKVLHHELSRDDLSVERFRREATTVAEIDNDHIVDIHDFGRTEDGRLYLAMELLVGETLDARIVRQKQLTVAETTDILVQLGEALMEAHAIGYVHRDLRPRNVFLSQRRNRANFVKLLDFGLAKLVEGEGGEAASTSLGMTFGDPKYMSPEQARGEPFDRRADIYALGCMAYEMLVGEPPFVGGRVFDILTRQVEERAKSVRELRADVPEWLAATVSRMLAKIASERFITVYRMIEALREGERTGSVMAPEVAQSLETEVPASITRAMEQFAEPGSKPYRVVPEPAAEASDRTEKTAAPDLTAAEATEKTAAPRPAAEPNSPSRTQRGILSEQVARHFEDEDEDEDDEGAHEQQDSGGTLRGPVGKVAKGAPSPTPVPGRIAIPILDPASAGSGRAAATAQRSESERQAAAVPAEPESHRHSGPSAIPASGERATGKNLSSSSSAGISAAWYADGDALETGEDVEPRAAEKLRRARVDAELSGEDTSQIYFDHGGRQRFVRLGIIGAVVLGGALAIAGLWPSSDGKQSAAGDGGIKIIAAQPAVTNADGAAATEPAPSATGPETVTAPETPSAELAVQPEPESDSKPEPKPKSDSKRAKAQERPKARTQAQERAKARTQAQERQQARAKAQERPKARTQAQERRSRRQPRQGQGRLLRQAGRERSTRRQLRGRSHQLQQGASARWRQRGRLRRAWRDCPAAELLRRRHLAPEQGQPPQDQRPHPDPPGRGLPRVR